MSDNFFPSKPIINPQIYAYTDSNYAGLLKIGFTYNDVDKRVKQQYPTLRPEKAPYKIVYKCNAMRNDGSVFNDHDIHKYLRSRKIKNPNGEWFESNVDDLKAAVIAVKSGKNNYDNRTNDFKMRPEQEEAVNKTYDYFNSYRKENPSKIPHFLWNAKMRFGKTFAAYQLAKKMNWKKILILTFKPAVKNAWEEELNSHIDFEDWQFISKTELSSYKNIDKSKPFVCFGSFQDYLGKNIKTGGIKAKNEWVHAINWDCVILDEYHYGAWRENAKDLFESEDKKEQDYANGEGIEYFDEETMPITTDAYLYLSGTPFRAISSGEFIEEQIYNWTYSDEQRAKENWVGSNNPYISLPRMVLLTYQLPDSINEIAFSGEFNEFDINVFFSANGEENNAKFKYENEVQKWLDLIRGSYLDVEIDNLKLGDKKPPMPYSDVRLLNLLSHTFWFLPSVASCYAMKNLLKQKQNKFYHDYEIIVSAGKSAGIGAKALDNLEKKMVEPLKNKTITLSCGKLTTGVTVRPWTGIFMLRNLSSPESYFQAAFRVQSPWVVKDGTEEVIIKKECYVFDFCPNRALKQIVDYSCRLNIDETTTPEDKVKEFISFLPILAYDGSTMKDIDASGILDIAMSGTSATLLARRWQSALLVNVDNDTLSRLLNSKAALEALENIEDFRGLNNDIEIIINKSEAVKKIRKEANDKEIPIIMKNKLSEDEKEFKSKRKVIQKKLIKFATRIPIFMYLTDFREETLKHVITRLEPELFKKVTGLNVEDFELLVRLGVFNGSLMDSAVFNFKRYEESSLLYTGVNKHENENIGLFEKTIAYKEFHNVNTI